MVVDASFSVYALLGLGYADEAAAFGGWLRDRIREQAGESSGPLKIMYRVDGSSDLEEEALDHLEGYRGSRPVRIGNGAADQLQLDIYGEAMDSIYLADTHGLQGGTKAGPSTRTCSTGSARTGISPRRVSGRLAEVASNSLTAG